jgi:hypothetical protein
LIVDIENDIL